ncbi:MAG: hypothetical protein HQM00_09815 [Magnetococcales bacterium]|nr:hypothetical protein [Magnetococcales bacterium]
MKTIVACHHCHAKFKTLTDHVPAHGRPAPCPFCGHLLVLWKSDDYYPAHFSQEIACFLLHCKQIIPPADAKVELEHLGTLELWLTDHHKTLATATRSDLERFLNMIHASRSQPEADEAHRVLYRFYEVLTEKEWIHANPLRPPTLPDEIPTDSEAQHPVPKRRLASIRPLLWLSLAGLLLTVGALRYSDTLRATLAPWLPTFLAAFLPAPSDSDTPGATHKPEAAQETAVSPPKVDPIDEASRQYAEEMDRWAQEVVQRAHYIREADQAIQELRKEREQRRAKEEDPPKPTPAVKPKSSPCVSGNCRDGTGRFRFDNGDEYQGSWRGGQRHGTGLYTYANGETYQGSWRQDRMEGTGTFRYANGSRYEGEWQANQRHGKGTLIYANGDKHVGEWRNDKRFGQGTRHLLFAEQLAKQQQDKALDQQRIQAEEQQLKLEEEKRQSVAVALQQGKSGCIEGDCQHGQGIYLYPSGDTYSGQWRDGIRHGQGVYQFKNGDIYSGEWQNNQKHGQGSYLFQNGQRYDGGWHLNKKHGVGTITFANGLRLRGQWENGEQRSP